MAKSKTKLALSAPEQLAAWMKAKDLSREQAGELFGCSPTYVSMLRKGSFPPGPSLSLASRIEAATGIPAKAWRA